MHPGETWYSHTCGHSPPSDSVLLPFHHGCRLQNLLRISWIVLHESIFATVLVICLQFIIFWLWLSSSGSCFLDLSISGIIILPRLSSILVSLIQSSSFFGASAGVLSCQQTCFVFIEASWVLLSYFACCLFEVIAFFALRNVAPSISTLVDPVIRDHRQHLCRWGGRCHALQFADTFWECIPFCHQ